MSNETILAATHASRSNLQKSDGLVIFGMPEKTIAEMDYRTAWEFSWRTNPGVVITPQWLSDVAVRAEARYKELLEAHPAGTIHDERNIMHTIAESALIVGEWMERTGLKSATFAGPFGPALPQRGQRVVIRRGAVVRYRGADTTTQRVQHVSVFSADRGYVDYREGSRPGQCVPVRQAQVSWAGAGGYWRDTDANNLVEPAPEVAA
jgi:hypothetical protein